MCGIAGLAGPGAAAIRATAMADALRHRGPDGSGVWEVARFALSHRRLSIIDIAGGVQPMASASGRWVLVYNGELYNYRELRDGALADYPYRTESDTEVILAGLDRWGEDTLPALKGMFAIAAYDREQGRLLLARDGQGIKPLYFTRLRDGTLAFASEIAGLRAAGYSAEVDEAALQVFLDVRFVPSPDTLFRGVQKLRPGHFVTVAGDGTVSEQRRFVARAPEIDRATSRDARVALLREALLHGVGSQLVADVPVGILLSGGVDSAVVAAAAVRARGGRIDTFCVGYSQDHWSNEFAEARETARLLGTGHHELEIDADAAIMAMAALIGHLEEPVVTTSLFSYFLLCEAVAKHRKVVLSGQGADEPWGGYGRHRVAALGGALAPMRMLPEKLTFLGGRQETWARLRAAVSASSEDARWAALHMLFDGEDRERLRRGAPAGRAGAAAFRVASADLPANGTDLERLLALETRTSLPDNLLMLGDKLSMAWGLEVRVPLLDPDYLALVEATPGKWRRGGFLASTGKLLHKRVCETLLPAEIVHRPKKGFQSPIEAWLRSSLGNHLAAMIERPKSFTRTFLDLTTARALLNRHKAARTGSLERQLFGLWVLEEWYARYFGAK